MIEVEAEELESEQQGDIEVESEYVEHMSAERFDRELVRRVAEVNGLDPSYVASRRNVMLDFSELEVGPGDFD